MNVTLIWALGGACLMFVLYLINTTRIRKKTLVRSTENFIHASIIHQSMSRIVHDTSVDRAIVLVAENGGLNKYGTILAEIHSNKTVPVMNEFVRYKLDRDYLQMLEELIDTKTIFLKTSEMKPGFLKHRYEHDKITHGIVYMIYEGRESGINHLINLFISRLFRKVYLFRRIYYVSFTSKSEKAFYTQADFMIIQSEVNKIINLFQNNFHKP